MPQLPPTSTQVDHTRYCFLNTRVSKSRNLRIALIGTERCRPDYYVERAGFACYAIEFIVSGRGTAILDGKSYPLCPGTFFCYGPQTAHVIATDPGAVMTKFFIDFHGSDAAPMLAMAGLQAGQILYTPEIESFRCLFETMLAEGDKALSNASDICACYLKALLLKTNQMRTTQGEQSSRSLHNFQRCQTFIDTHFLELKDLRDIGKRLNLTPPYICRLFSKYGHPGPFEYLTRKKLNRAAEILISTGCTVKFSALKVGYSDPYHFSRAFHRHFGVSPTDFVAKFAVNRS
jgi:AraC-like DNA-binding protein